MTLLDVLTARLTILVLNGLCLAVVLPMSFALAMFAGMVAFVLLLAPLSGLVAFARRQRRRSLLGVAAVANLLLLAAATPLLHQIAREGTPLPWFMAGALALFVAPLLTISACWLRWPPLRRAAVAGFEAGPSILPGTS